MAYTDKSAVKAYLGISTTDDDGLLDSLIGRAQSIIDSQTSSTFEAANDSTRYYTADDVIGDALRLDADLCAITSITNGDGNAVTQYRTEPRNAKPWHRIIIKDGAWDASDDIAVTGRWAYMVTANNDIQHACIRLTAWLYRQKDNHTDLDRATVVGNMTILPARLPADIDQLLKPYKRHT